MLRRVTRAECVEALVELLPTQTRGWPPELAARRVDERAARYVAELRLGKEGESVFLVALRGKRVRAVASVSPSPLDQEAMGLAVGRVTTLEVIDEGDAELAIKDTERAAKALGLELLFARASPSSPAIPALIAHGFGVYGATVLYAGPLPRDAVPPSDVERATGRQQVAEAGRLVRLAFDDTHLSRDRSIDVRAGRGIYEAWVKAEAERGAHVLVARHTRRAVAVAVCRDNALAREHLGVDQWHLHLLAVHPRFRGAGYGRRALEAAIATAKSAGAEVFQTGVDTASLTAQRLYARAGLLPSSSSLALHKWM